MVKVEARKFQYSLPIFHLYDESGLLWINFFVPTSTFEKFETARLKIQIWKTHNLIHKLDSIFPFPSIRVDVTFLT